MSVNCALIGGPLDGTIVARPDAAPVLRFPWARGLREDLNVLRPDPVGEYRYIRRSEIVGLAAYYDFDPASAPLPG